MYGGRFKKELGLIVDALTNEKKEQEFRKYIGPYVESVIKSYIADNHITGVSNEDLRTAAWRYFKTALRNYRVRAEQMLKGKNDLFYFSSYFNWFIRQGILEFLRASKK